MLKKLTHILLILVTCFTLTTQSAQAERCNQNQSCSNPNQICNHVTETCIDPPPDLLKDGVTDETFDAVNPLIIGESEHQEQFKTPGGIMTRVLQYAFPIAGMILFVMIVWGGFEILAGAQEKKSLDSGKQRVTAAIVGFLLLFASYWIAQIIEYIFGITIL